MNETRQILKYNTPSEKENHSWWGCFIKWSLANSLQSCLDIVGGAIAIILVILMVYNIGNLDAFVKKPIPIIFAACIPIIQFFCSYLTTKASDLYAKTVKELALCNDKVSRIEPLINNFEVNFDVWLLYILKVMHLGNDSRASFYLYDDRGGCDDRFTIVARESMDPKLKRKGRREFPWNQGVIGRAWTGNQCSFFCNDKITGSQYAELMVKDWNFKQEAARQLTMQAHAIMGHVILDFEKRKVGVIIVESLSGVKKKEQDGIEKSLANIVSDVSPYLSRLFSIYADILLNQENPRNT